MVERSAMRVNDHLPVADNKAAVLSADQFEVLTEMLRPGYELATLMLADYKSKAAAASEPALPLASDSAQT
jgi:hypothetical protein